jgi:hypothetical protein
MKRSVWFLVLFCLSCTSTPKTPSVHLSLVNNNYSVKFKGLDLTVISEINRDSAAWQTLLPVYRMPSDTDLKNYQPAQPGTYQLKDSAIVFTPDTPFSKGQIYFMRFYQFGGGSSPMDFIRGRKKLGNTRYMDLIFKGG